MWAAEALEFLGAYLIGRAFVFGPRNLQLFSKIIGQIAVVLVSLALLDTFSGRNVTAESFGITPMTIGTDNYRLGLVPERIPYSRTPSISEPSVSPLRRSFCMQRKICVVYDMLPSRFSEAHYRCPLHLLWALLLWLQYLATISF